MARAVAPNQPTKTAPVRVVCDLHRRVVLEFVGTALLLATIVGSGIMAETLAGGNTGLALLCNTIATAGALFSIITVLGPICGAHLNPIVTAVEAIVGARQWGEVLPYSLAQIAGGIAGVAVANAMFANPLLFFSHRSRGSAPEVLAEAVATFGLIFIIFVGVRSRPSAVPATVAAYITAAYWFTSSTSFANPAVTIARSLSDTFAGIRPSDVPLFVVAEIVGGGVAALLIRWVFASAVATLARSPH